MSYPGVVDADELAADADADADALIANATAVIARANAKAVIARANANILIACSYNRTLIAYLSSRRMLVTRLPLFGQQRLRWDEFQTRFSGRPDIQRHLRMPFASFTKLVEMIRAQLVVDESQALRRGGAILPEMPSRTSLTL